MIRKLHGKICDDFESSATDRQAAKPNTAAFKQMTPPERYCAMREAQPESIKKKLIETTQAIPSGFYLHYKFTPNTQFQISNKTIIWLVVSTPLKNIRQLG